MPKRVLPPTECKKCYRSFVPKHKTHFYCSKECRESLPFSPEIAQAVRLRFQILARDKFRCRYCGRDAACGVRLELDHVLPMSKGGTWEYHNLVAACSDCNQGKKAAIMEDKTIRKIWKKNLKMYQKRREKLCSEQKKGPNYL